MSAFWAGVAGLIGGALGRSATRSPGRDQAPQSTIACLQLVLEADARSKWVGSLEEAYRELKPYQAYAAVELVQRLAGDPTIVDNIRQHTARLIADAQTDEGFFDVSLYYDDSDGIARPPVRTPIPGAPRFDQVLYDMQYSVDVLHLLNSVNVPINDRPALVRWIQVAQTAEGRFATEERYNQLFIARHPVDELLADAEEGFPIEYHHPLLTGARPYNEIEETAHAVRALHLLGAQPRDVAACVAWLQRWQQPDGSFAGPHHPDMLALRNDGYDLDTVPADELPKYYRPFNFRDLEDTYWAVLALDALGAQPRDLEGCRRWLAQAVRMPRADAGHGNVAQRWYVMWERLEALYRVGGRLPDEQEWIRVARQRRTGGILKVMLDGRPRIDAAHVRMDDLVDTAQSFHILEVMGGLDSAFLATFK
jgi:hypothetical protein